MLQDFRYAIRRMWQGRAWSAMVVLSCALGIGASAAMFSLVEAVLLRDLEVERPDELVYLNWYSGPNGLYQFLSGNSDSDETGRKQSTSFSTLTFEQIKQQTRTLAHVFAFAPLREANIRVDDLAEIADGQFVSGNYFSSLRLLGLRGRPLLESDDQLAATPAAVISDRYWQQRFRRNPNAIGQTLHVNGIAFTIVGITPPGFAGAHGYSYVPDFSIPLAFEARMFPDDEHSRPWSWWLRIMGRLSPDVTRAQAQSELEPLIQHTALQGWNVAPARAQSRNQTRDLPHLQVLDGSRGLADQVRNITQMMTSLAAIVGLLMLIVCVNVANLMLAQAANRQREFGVRLALGASRQRLVRLLLTETAVLCGAAVLLGVLLAAWGIDVLALVVSKANGTSVDLRLDLRVLAFAVVSALMAGAAFGLTPALRATGIDVVTQVKEGASNVLGRRSPVTRILVVAQLALSLALLVGAGLLVQSVRGLRRVDVGFDANNLLLFELNPEAVGYDEQRSVALYEDVIRRIETLPGVTAATSSEYRW
jgi:predicted permease